MEPVSRASIYALRLGWRKADDKYWHYAYKRPEVGIGLEYLDIHNDEEIGNPWSAYTFIEAGLIDRKRFRLALTVDFGLSYFWRPYNTQTNDKNLALGSVLNYHVGLGFRSNIFLTENISAVLATILNHHSNGAVTKPNLGINMASVEVGLKYNWKKRTIERNWTDTTRQIRPYTEFSIFSGTRNIVPDGSYQGFVGLHTNRMYPISGLFAFGGGAELLYDSAAFQGLAAASVGDRLSVAGYLSAIVFIQRVSLSMDFGRYMYRKEGDRDISHNYQRMSLRYQLTDRLFLAAKVRAFELRKADLLEFHIGIRI